LPRNHVDQRSGAPQRAVKGRCYVIGVNPAVHADQIPANFPDRERVWRTDPDDPEWVEPGNAVIVGTNGEILAGPARHTESWWPSWTSPRRCRRDGCSTRSALTTAPTCYDSASTPPRPVVTTLHNGHADE
jgi:nitrilase